MKIIRLRDIPQMTDKLLQKRYSIFNSSTYKFHVRKSQFAPADHKKHVVEIRNALKPQSNCLNSVDELEKSQKILKG